jgi:hypothetical protein
MMSLWLNLRRSLSNKSIPKSTKFTVQTAANVSNSDGEKREIFTFPYGTKECVVYKQKGKINKVSKKGT